MKFFSKHHVDYFEILRLLVLTVFLTAALPSIVHAATPTVSNGGVTNITQTSADLSGSIDDTGGSNAIRRGFRSYPDGESLVQESGDFETGGYTLTYSGLDCGTTYGVQAFAENGDGIGEDGSEMSFTTSDCTSVPVFSDITPASSGYINNVMGSSDISFTVDSNLTSGSLTITRTGGATDPTTTRTCTFVGTALNTGAHTINLSDTTNSCSSAQSDLVDGAEYSFVFAAANIDGPASPVTSTTVTFDTSVPAFSTITPTSTSTIDNVTSASDISYISSEVLSSGSVTLTRTGGTTDDNSPHICTLVGTALGVGSTILDLTDLANSCESDVSNLINGTVYSILFEGTDLAGNTATPVTRSNVTFSDGYPSCYAVDAADTNSNIITSNYVRVYDYNGGQLAYTNPEAWTNGDSSLAYDTGTGNWYIGHAFSSNDYELAGPASDASGTYTAVGAYTGSPIVSTCDSTPPSLSSVSIDSNNASSTLAKAGNQITLTFTVDETIATPTVSFNSGGVLASSSPVITNTTGDTWTASYIITAGNTNGAVTFTIDFADLAGNNGTQVTSVTDGSSVVVDRTAPSLTSIASSTTATTATVAWTTSGDLSTSTVNYGSNTSYGSASSSQSFVTSHTIVITGLSTGTTYHYQVVSTDAAGNTSTSSDKTFVTVTLSAPTLSTSAASGLSTTGATLNGSISDDGGVTVTDRGFAYGTTTAYGATTMESGSFSTGSFSAGITGLTCGTAYNYQAYAVNSVGTSTGSNVSFTTSACATNNSGSSGGSRSGGSSGGSTYVPPTSTSSLYGLIPFNPYATVQTPSSSANDISLPKFTRNLKNGDVGNDVRNLQIFLNSQGFIVATTGLGSPGHESTVFGPATVKALIKYQNANKGFLLTPLKLTSGTGIFGAGTRAFVNAQLSTESTTMLPAPKTFTKDLKLGMTDAQVKKLQEYLNIKGFTIAKTGNGSAGKESTYFGKATELALIRYQKARGITPALGYFGAKTRALMNAGK